MKQVTPVTPCREQRRHLGVHEIPRLDELRVARIMYIELTTSKLTTDVM